MSILNNRDEYNIESLKITEKFFERNLHILKYNIDEIRDVNEHYKEQEDRLNFQ